MNKKLMFAIPIMAAVLTIGTGAGVIYAKSVEPSASYKPISNYASTASTASNTQATVAYCGGFGGMMGLGAGQGLVTSQVANLLGTTVADLKAQLDSGKTLSDIATAKGVSQDQLIQTIMAPFTDRMSLMLKYDYLTQDQINSMTQQMSERLQTLITSPLNSAHENVWGFMQDMMDDYSGDMMNNYGGGMMGGWGNPQVQSGATQTPQSPGSTSTPRTGFGGMMGRW
jgi:hypothetical protein